MGWSNDKPSARHPWVVSQAVRLEAAVVLGCLSSADEAAARDALAERLSDLTVGENREDADSELARVWSFAQVRVAQMGEPRLRAELGEHQHRLAEDPKPSLDVTNHSIAGAEARKVIGSGPTSSMFVRGGQIVVVPTLEPEPVDTPSSERLDSALQVSAVNGVRLAAELDLRYSIVKSTKDSKCDPAIFPREVATRLASAPEHLEQLRPLRGVTRTPFVRPDWSICSRPGYDAATGVLYVPRGGGIEIPERVTRGDVDDAVALLSLMLSDFPWKSPSDRANFLAALIWPLIVHTHSDVSPALILNAHQPASGKTLLAEILRTLFDGALRPDWPTGKEEQEKELAAILSSGTGAYAVFDNVRGKLASGALEGLLTQRDSSMRKLGSNNECLRLANDRTFVFTGNNVTIGGDLARRVVWCSIDPGMPNPEMRSAFAISGSLIGWVKDNREFITRALLVMVAHWIGQGRPIESSRSDSFASTIDVAQGILSVAGIDGRVADVNAIPVAGASEDDEWREWYVVLSAHFKGEQFRAAELFGLLTEASDGYLERANTEVWTKAPSSIQSGLKSGHLSTRGLGMYLTHRVGRYYGVLSLQVIQDERKGHRYVLRSYSAGGSHAEAG